MDEQKLNGDGIELGLREVYVTCKSEFPRRFETWIYEVSENRIMLDWCSYKTNCNPLMVELGKDGHIVNRCLRCSGRNCKKPFPTGCWTWSREYPKGSTFMGRKGYL